jgi:hypothetical protein
MAPHAHVVLRAGRAVEPEADPGRYFVIFRMGQARAVTGLATLFGGEGGPQVGLDAMLGLEDGKNREV